MVTDVNGPRFGLFTAVNIPNKDATASKPRYMSAERPYSCSVSANGKQFAFRRDCFQIPAKCKY